MINLGEPVYIHLDFNNYEAELMKTNEEGIVYKYTCMCPPGKVKYFFTSNKFSYFARDHKIEKEALKVNNIKVFDEVK